MVFEDAGEDAGEGTVSAKEFLGGWTMEGSTERSRELDWYLSSPRLCVFDYLTLPNQENELQ